MSKTLANGIRIVDTYHIQFIKQLDDDFLAYLRLNSESIYKQLLSARKNPKDFDRKAESEFLVELSDFLEQYLAIQFGITDEIKLKQKIAIEWQKFFVEIKRKFVKRRGLKKWTPIEVGNFDEKEIKQSAQEYFGEFIGALQFEQQLAQLVCWWLNDENKFQDQLNFAEKYCAWAVISKSGKERHQNGYLFKLPELIDHFNLVGLREIEFENIKKNGQFQKAITGKAKLRNRDGFGLTDQIKNDAHVYDQSHYCIWCHQQGVDSCQIGCFDRKTGQQLTSPLGIDLVGCPLSEKISEMNLLKASGKVITPVAIAMVDNPMIAGTGHRICNECTKSCIFQRQTPVDIPQAETGNFEDLINLPFGFEIYSLLTRWNPLNLSRPFTKKPTNKKILIVGLGPAGYTLSHHLLQEGHCVVAIDGLKIEPLPASLSGINQEGDQTEIHSIEKIEVLMDNLDNRILYGFGGVSEYGITVRWNKNYLKLIRIILERNPNFRLFGGVRLGNGNGTITTKDALDLGFDHIALCMGAGKPTVIPLENGFARGVRQASDFLMALQLTGAAKKDSLANLQIRMPIVIIGGGLTAIDAATESIAYYIRQVEKFTIRSQILKEAGISWRPQLNDEEKNIANEFIDHGNQVIAERKVAKDQNRQPNFNDLIKHWGGVVIAYRRKLIESPAYKLNHEEIVKAFEEGIGFYQQFTPKKVEIDQYGHCQKLIGEDVDGTTIDFTARSILIAAGSSPNTVIARESKFKSNNQIGEEILLDGKYFQAIDENGKKIKPENNPKPKTANILIHKFKGIHQNKYMSYFGDLHPSFFGNVVKAMASAKQGYPIISQVLNKIKPNLESPSQVFFNKLSYLLIAKVIRLDRLTANIVEVVIQAPQAAKNFKAGQFYRLQNFENTANSFMFKNNSIKLAMEGVALTGAWVDTIKGEIGLIALEMGGSSSLISTLVVEQPVVLMGPTGAPTEIDAKKTVLLAGGGLGNAVLFSIGKAFKALGSKVLYFAAYKKTIDRYHQSEIENAADLVVWCCDSKPGFSPSVTRPQDKSFVGNIVEAMVAYAEGRLGKCMIELNQVNKIIAIGSHIMMEAVAKARHHQLAPYLSHHQAIGSINSPMQCMMKEICSQCIQLHKDINTGKTFHVFSCFNQDQELDSVDWHMLDSRLKQNSVQEKQTAALIKHCLNDN